MNNSQFRRLLYDKPKSSASSNQDGGPPPSATPSSRNFLPMTPRTVKGESNGSIDFARQVRERNASLQPTKKFKTATPRGVKYASGYVDRAKARAEQEEDDDKASRIKALEEQMKLGQISAEVFEGLRDNIIGGKVEDSHLVKGLDWRLLERVRRGEDVLGVGAEGEEKVEVEDVDEELDKLGEQEIVAQQRAVKREVEKRGTMAPPSARVGAKRSRDELMAELKAKRQAAAQAKAAPSLDSSRWRKVGNQQQRRKVEIDHKGREVITTVDEDGNVKKKVRKLQPQEKEKVELDATKPVLGSDTVVPEPQIGATAKDEDGDSDNDIFEGVGTTYDPLGNGEDDDDDESSEDDEDDQRKPSERTEESIATTESTAKDEGDSNDGAGDENASSPKDDKHNAESHKPPATGPRNYFDTTTTSDEPETSTADRYAGVQSILAKAAKLDPLTSSTSTTKTEAEAEERRKRMLEQQDRDFEDMDMGFGGSRFDDGEDGEDGGKVKLSEWKGGEGEFREDGKGGAGGKGGGGAKKRRPKKRKGDVNSAADIMRVIEARKGGGGK